MDTGPDPARTRIALVGCVALLGVTAALVGTVVPAWAYPIINTTVAVALIAMALAAAATPVAIGLTLGRRAVIATAIGLISVAAVLAAGWTLPSIRQVFTTSPAASMSSATAPSSR